MKVITTSSSLSLQLIFSIVYATSTFPFLAVAFRSTISFVVAHPSHNNNNNNNYLNHRQQQQQLLFFNKQNPTMTSTSCFSTTTSTTSDSDSNTQQNNNNNNNINDNDDSNRKHLVLVGGGHAHLQVIKAFNGRDRPDNVDVTVIDLQEAASYSGMVPGCIANMYTPEQTLIQLRPLTKWANITFVHGKVIDLNLTKQEVLVETSKNNDETNNDNNNYCISIPYDVLSLDIGSTTRGLQETPGALEYTIPTRPISKLVQRIQQETDTTIISSQKTTTKNQKKKIIHLVVIGGGAAGIELSMSIRSKWQQAINESNSENNNNNDDIQLSVTLLDSGNELLPNETNACRKALKSVMNGIHVIHNASIDKIDKTTVYYTTAINDNNDDTIISQQQQQRQHSLPYTTCIWATGAGAHELPLYLAKTQNFAVSNRGWIRVNTNLQSLSHPNIFAAGDCVTIEDFKNKNKPSPPKAGVYAVRSGPILIQNLHAALMHVPGRKVLNDNNNNDNNESLFDDTTTTTTPTSTPVLQTVTEPIPDLVEYQPQDDFLKLLVCGKQKALGFRFGIPIYGTWVWQLKDAIDVKFMNLFQQEYLPQLFPKDNNKNNKQQKKYDTSQYDATFVTNDSSERLSPNDAAILLQRTDDDVDYNQAWRVLKDMTNDFDYQKAVLEIIKSLLSNENNNNNKNNNVSEKIAAETITTMEQ